MVVDTSVPREPHSSITEEDYEEESAIETDEPASDVTVEEDCTDGTSADEESSEEYEAEMDDYEMEAEDSHEPGVIEEWMYSIPTKAPDYHEEGEEGHEPDPSGNMPEDAGETGEG
jgi:hypothetical protein